MRQQAGYEKYFIYGVLILVCLLIIGGLLAALTHREEGLLGRIRREERKKDADEGKEEAKEQDEAVEIAINNPNIRVLIMTNGYANIVQRILYYIRRSDTGSRGGAAVNICPG